LAYFAVVKITINQHEREYTFYQTAMILISFFLIFAF